jgi:hypothetical protein
MNEEAADNCPRDFSSEILQNQVENRLGLRIDFNLR